MYEVAEVNALCYKVQWWEPCTCGTGCSQCCHFVKTTEQAEKEIEVHRRQRSGKDSAEPERVFSPN